MNRMFGAGASILTDKRDCQNSRELRNCLQRKGISIGPLWGFDASPQEQLSSGGIDRAVSDWKRNRARFVCRIFRIVARSSASVGSWATVPFKSNPASRGNSSSEEPVRLEIQDPFVFRFPASGSIGTTDFSSSIATSRLIQEDWTRPRRQPGGQPVKRASPRCWRIPA